MSEPTLTEKSYKSLYPKGQIAWKGMQTGGVMRQISDGISIQAERDRQAGKDIVNNFFPGATALIKEWEEVFKLPSGELLTQSQRLSRLMASFSKQPSPASFDGMNEIYALSGIPVIARPLVPGEDPRVIAESDQDVLEYTSVFGGSVFGPNTVFGGFETIPGTAGTKIYADGRSGNEAKNYTSVFGPSAFGDLSDSSRFGNFEGSRLDPPDLTIPDDDWTWSMIYIIEGSGGDFAQVPAELKEAFEFLTYKSKPLFMWAISRVVFV